MRTKAEVIGFMLLAGGCITPLPEKSGIVTASLVHPDGTPPRPNVPRGDCCDDPHPKNADGTLKHDDMLCGDGLYRCWFCNRVKR